MPGLAAIISRSRSRPHEIDVARMVQSMRHEPFYRTGTYSNSDLGVYVGWVCHPGSFSDCNPAKSLDGNLILFFHGEHLEEAGESHDIDARQPWNAQVVLRLFEMQGVAALQRLNGWFNGVLIDVEREEVLVFNDRFGMQRLYVNESSEATLYASEAKAILAVRPHLRRIDEQGLAEFLTCGCVLENRSLFTGVHTLPAATAVTFRRSQKSEEKRYFDIADWERQAPMGRAEFHDSMRQTLHRAVARCVRSSHLQVGVSLTGGYDTRLVMANLDLRNSPLPTYTFGGMYRDCFDVTIARKVAKLTGCDHQVLGLGEDFLEAFPALAERSVYISDGCLGATNAYELSLNARARDIAPVRLTGSLGSEVMRGSRAFKAVPPTSGLISSGLSPQIERAVSTFDGSGKGHPVTFSVLQHAPWLYHNRLAVEQSQVIVRTPFMDNDLVRLMYRLPEDREDVRMQARRLIEDGNPALAKLPTDSGNSSLPRQKLMEFLIKADYCYKSGMPNWLEQIHYRLGPLQPERYLIGRHRFTHFRVWFRNQLAGYVKEILLDPRTAARPWFNHGRVAEMVARHIQGDQNHTNDIERLLTVELACRSLVDG